MNHDFELGEDRTNPRVESDSVFDHSSSETRVDSASLCLTGTSGHDTGVHGDERVVMDRVSAEGDVSDVENREAGDSNKLGVFEFDDSDVFSDRKHGSIKNGRSEQRKGHGGREVGKLKKSGSPVYDSMLSMFDDFAANGGGATEVGLKKEVSRSHGFQVGDMVWGKVKSHPWWPGHVYSEEFATPSVRRSKREGLLLVAFFGDSSYGWFDPSELIPFDTNFAEKSSQTISKTFVKAVEEAVDEVSRRRGLGLSCMCRNKQNFRQTGIKGFFSVDVADYEPGAVYSIDVIEKARDGFQPRSALDFVRQLALAPTSAEHAGIDFIKNKATVMSYRKAIYEEFDDTYAQAFGQPPSTESVQEPPPGKTQPKAPLSGRQVFADTSGKGKSVAKPTKPKDHTKKDKYLFKRRDESNQNKKGKVISSPQAAHVEDPLATAAGEYMLQRRVPATHEQVGTVVADGELASRDPSEMGASMEETPIVLKYDNESKIESSSSSSAGEVSLDYSGHLSEVRLSVDEENRVMPEMENRKTSSSLVNDKPSQESKVLIREVAMQREDGGQKKGRVHKRPVGDLGSGKSIMPENKKKRKKELLMSDGTQIRQKERVPLVGRVSANKSTQSALAPDRQRTDGKAITSSSLDTRLGNDEVDLPRVLVDLHLLALDPFYAIKRGWPVKARQVFLRFRSLVFQKSLALPSQADDEANETHPSKSPAVTLAMSGPENDVEAPPVKPLARPSGRPDDPTKSGRKRDPYDRQEDIAAKKKKVTDIRNSTTEKKLSKRSVEPPRGEGKQAVNPTPRKGGSEFMKKTEQRAPEPTMLTMKFPAGGYLPSVNELKAKFAGYGPMDHSGTRIFWNTFTCRVVYKHKAHAQDAYKSVVGKSSLFGNSDVKCSLKAVGVESGPPVKVPKEDVSIGAHQPGLEHRPSVLPDTSGLQLKSCLKKSGGEEAGGGNGGRGLPRVKFLLGGEESNKNRNVVVNNSNNNNNATSFADDGGASSFSSSHSTMDINSSKNFQKTILPPSLPSPHPVSTTVSSSSSQFTRPPLSSMHYGTGLARPPRPPPLPPPPISMHYGNEPPPPPQPPRFEIQNLNRPISAPMSTSNVDVTQQMLSLLMKCNDVVTNVTSLFGYVPYHPL